MKKERKRLAGEGSISWSEKRQRYVVALSVGGSRVYRYARTEKDAVDLLQDLRVKHGLVKYSKSMTLAEWYPEWLHEIKAPALKPRSVADYQNVFDKHVKEYPLAKMAISEITKTDVTRHFNALHKDGKSLQTIKKVKLRLTGCFNGADDYITKNPVPAAALPNAKDNSRTYTKDGIRPMFAGEGYNAFNGDDQNTLLAALRKEEDWYTDFLFIFILGTGLRLGEALALNYQFDLRSGCVLIHKAMQRTPVIENRKVVRYERKLGSPKSDNSTRTVPLPKVLVPQIEKRIQEIKAKEEDPFFEDQGLLFPNEYGGFLNDRRVLRRLKYLEDCLGLPNVNVHGLRHSYATRLLELGEPIQAISKLLGHSRVELTQETYSHVLDGLKEKTVSRLDEIFCQQPANNQGSKTVSEDLKKSQ